MGQEGFGAHSEAKLVSQFMQTKFLCHKMSQNSTIFSVSYSRDCKYKSHWRQYKFEWIQFWKFILCSSLHDLAKKTIPIPRGKVLNLHSISDQMYAIMIAIIRNYRKKTAIFLRYVTLVILQNNWICITFSKFVFWLCQGFGLLDWMSRKGFPASPIEM